MALSEVALASLIPVWQNIYRRSLESRNECSAHDSRDYPLCLETTILMWKCKYVSNQFCSKFQLDSV